MAVTFWLLGLALNPLFVMLPLGTLAANLVGGYLVGVAVGVFHINSGLPPVVKLFAITGFLGGLTTYSSFNYETMRLFEEGAPATAAVNLAFTVLGGALAGWLGLVAAREVLGR